MDERVNVDIFFPRLGSSGDPNNFFKFQPIRRVVDRVRPIRPAITKLLNGPSPLVGILFGAATVFSILRGMLEVYGWRRFTLTVVLGIIGVIAGLYQARKML